jgi:hypothetical protein
MVGNEIGRSPKKIFKKAKKDDFLPCKTTHRPFSEGICPDKIRNRTNVCSTVVIRLNSELEGKNDAEAQVVVAIRGRVVVAISDAAVLRVVVPATAAIHTVRAF